jgi:hypothetical protein
VCRRNHTFEIIVNAKADITKATVEVGDEGESKLVSIGYDWAGIVDDILATDGLRPEQ